jgi:type II secretory pathway predicted ATPase ExeA
VYALAHAACLMARRYRNFSVLTGYVGTGKTFALKQYQRTHKNTWLIEATPTMTPQSLVRLLSSTILGAQVKGSTDEKFRAVIESVSASDSLLIVDEAERLGLAQMYQLRGRVGRSTRQAWAYFFYSRGKKLTAEALQRLAKASAGIRMLPIFQAMQNMS